MTFAWWHCSSFRIPSWHLRAIVTRRKLENTHHVDCCTININGEHVDGGIWGTKGGARKYVQVLVVYSHGKWFLLHPSWLSFPNIQRTFWWGNWKPTKQELFQMAIRIYSWIILLRCIDIIFAAVLLRLAHSSIETYLWRAFSYTWRIESIILYIIEWRY